MAEPSPASPSSRRLTFWLWGILGGVLLLLGAPFLVGVFLPDEAIGSASAVVAAEPDAVWRSVQDPQRFPLSTALALEVRPLDQRESGPSWLEVQKNTTLTVTTLEQDPLRRLVRATSDREHQLDTHWELELAPAPGGTLVNLRQRWQVRGNAPQLRFVLRFMGGANMGPRAYVERLAEEFGRAP